MTAKRAWVLCLTLVLCGAAAQASPSANLADPAAWHAQPTWLPNPSAAPRLEAADGGMRLAVPEARKGMKWSRAVRGVWLGESPWLVVRYRASGLAPRKDYFVWLNAGEGADALRLDQVKADGAWHTIATDVAPLFGGEAVLEMAAQVQAGSADAWVEIAWLALAESPPDDADIVGQRTPPRRDWLLDEHAGGAWQPKPDWLDNAAERYDHERRGGLDIFSVQDAGLGMKWALYFDEPVEPQGYRYLSLRIRGQGNAIVGDYSIALLGDAAPDGRDYTVLASAALAVTEGRWRQVDLPLGAALKHARLVGLAVQVQAWRGAAIVEIAGLRLTAERRPVRLADVLSVRGGWPRGAAGRAVAVDVSGAAHLSAQQARVQFRVADWFPSARVMVENVPFRVGLGGGAVAATNSADESEVAVGLRGRASEVYLLLLARLTGPEEVVRGGGPLLRIADVDRLRVTLHYADGEARSALPLLVPPPGFGILDGAQVVCVRADPTRDLRELTLYLGTAQAKAGIAAITLNTTPRRRDEGWWRTQPAWEVREVREPLPEMRPLARRDGHSLWLANRYLGAEFDLERGLALTRLMHRAIGIECLGDGASPPLFGARVGERELGAGDFALAQVEPLAESDRQGYRVTYRCADPALEVAATLAVGDEPRVTCEIALRNLAPSEQTVEPIGPRLPPLAIGPGRDMWYLIPASATLLHTRPTTYSGWYSGAQMPLQFLDAFSPAYGGGVCLMVRDLESLEKRYHLAKSDAGVALAVDYQQRTLAPGETYALAPADIRLHTGDWHEAFHAYCDWADTWYAPAAERPRWWREVFNFRQRFLYRFDAMVDPATRAYRMGPALEQDARDFGGVEYLHIFDWGYQGRFGRIYGRTGDYDTGDYLPGGWEGFRAAVKQVQESGVPVGFYIEGYLLDERGLLGQAHGSDWQMLGRDRTRLRWPNSTELFICPAVEPWQEVQATTYARMVDRMDADGMYLDEFGFAGPGKWCWSPDHGHRVPSSSLQAEQALTRRVRQAMSAVKPGAVLYTEDTPTDVNSQYQEGAFCYSLQRHRWSGSPAPLKLFRFAFPDFKDIEILLCDQPAGTWATGVRWAFWNGEAIWLEGVGSEWFAPQTLRAIRDCHRALRAHRDAFAGDRAEPLVPTLAAGLYANMFRGESETAYTLYNARNETYSGEVIALPHAPGTRYLDAFAGREIEPRLSGGRAVLSLSVEPWGVGCIVARPGG